MALWCTLEQWMQAKGLGACARQLVKHVASIKSMDVLLPGKRGETTRELRLRVVATADPATAQLLAHRGLRLPKGSRPIAHVLRDDQINGAGVRQRLDFHLGGVRSAGILEREHGEGD